MSTVATGKSRVVPRTISDPAGRRRDGQRTRTRAARNVETAANRIIAVSDLDEARAAVIAPILHAVATAAEAETPSLDALLAVLERPQFLEHLRREDPLARARLRGIRARQRLLQAEGGVVSGQEFANLVGVSRQAIDKRRRTGMLIGLSLGKKGYHYPVWQAEIDGLKPVLQELRDSGPWAQLIFLLTPNSWLGGESPLALLRRGEVQAVVDAASMYGEQAGSTSLQAVAD